MTLLRRFGRLSLLATLCAGLLSSPAHATPSEYRSAVLQTRDLLSYFPLDDLAAAPGSVTWKEYTQHHRSDDLKDLAWGWYGAEVRPELNSPVNSGAHFEGADPDGTWESHMTLGNSFSFGNRQPLSVEVWVRADSVASITRRIFSKEDPSGGWLVGARSGKLVFSRVMAGLGALT